MRHYSHINETVDFLSRHAARLRETNVSEVDDRFEFSPERFAPSIVPNLNGSMPDAVRRALANGIFSF